MQGGPLGPSYSRSRQAFTPDSTAGAAQQSGAQLSQPAPRLSPHAHTLSPIPTIGRAAAARAAAAHRDAADSADSADVTVAVHHLRSMDGHSQSHGSRRQSTHAASRPTHRYHRNARNERATGAGRTRTVSSLCISSPCTACDTAAARVREPGVGRLSVAPRRPTDPTTPDSPFLRVARDPCDAASGRRAHRLHVSSAHRLTRLVVQLTTL